MAAMTKERKEKKEEERKKKNKQRDVHKKKGSCSVSSFMLDTFMYERTVGFSSYTVRGAAKEWLDETILPPI